MGARTWPLITICALTMCSRPQATQDTDGGIANTLPSTTEAAHAPNPAAESIVADPSTLRYLPRCGGELQDAMRAPALPGTPRLDAQRASIVARNKGEPVLFTRAPKFNGDATPVVRAYRRILESSRFPSDFFRRLAERGIDPQQLRQIVLKEGYLYGETLELAHALYQSFELRDLFSENELWIERGAERVAVAKGSWDKYYYASGPDKGSRARLLNFDRVGVVGHPYGPPIHRDVRSVMHQVGFDRMRIERITDAHIVASLRYGDLWVRSLLRTDRARVAFVCEEVPPEREKLLSETRARLSTQKRVLSALRESMLAQVREQLPFDEPDTEWGQEDGALFLRWNRAYLDGSERYKHHYDSYQVFTDGGQPRVPQVCVDFLTHTLERASGTWWGSKGEPRQRRVGGVDFDGLMGDSRRKVTAFVPFMKQHPELVEVKSYEPSRHRYRNVEAFYRYLERNMDDFQPGDMVFILGRAPWDHYNVPHYHSFFVYESDPVTGMPILLASNAGKPRIRSWEAEMGRAPLRGIRYRVRPKLAWLSRVIPSSFRTSANTPPLVATIP